MNEMLKELWYGNLRPQEEITRQSPVYRKMAKQNEKDWSAFLQTLTEQQQAQVRALLEDTDEMHAYYAYLAFRFGVQMGQDFLYKPTREMILSGKKAE